MFGLPVNDPYNGEWNDSYRGDFLWSNTNFGEAVTETMTPLAWSVLQFTLDDWLFLPGFSTVGNMAGRPYLNISIFASLFHALRRSRQDLISTLEGTLYMQLPEEMEIPLISLSAKDALQGMLYTASLGMRQKQGVRRLPSYLADNPAWFKQMSQRIRDERSLTALARLWREEISPHVKRGVWVVLGTVTYSTDYTLHLRRELTDLVGPEDAGILIANLNDGVELLPSLGPVVGLARVASGEMERSAYLEQYGHRGPHEFEISIPRPVEDGSWLEQQLAHFHAQPLDIATRLAKQQTDFDAAWQRLAEHYPRKAVRLRRRLAESARRGRLREQARSEYTRDRWLVRVFACQVGELCGLEDDIFFLMLDEMLALLDGDRSAKAFIPRRREIYERLKSFPPPPPIIRGRFDPFTWAADPARRSDIFDAKTIHPIPSSEVIRGAAGSAGCVVGVVRRLDGPEQGEQLRVGEVLVTALTDISWTPIFPRAAAVITDVGAPLSHAAIVARELGIPAVVGCGDATTRLKTGDHVRVNGSRGVVELLATSSAPSNSRPSPASGGSSPSR